mgnify:CR=1 FL=1
MLAAEQVMQSLGAWVAKSKISASRYRHLSVVLMSKRNETPEERGARKEAQKVCFVLQDLLRPCVQALLRYLALFAL